LKKYRSKVCAEKTEVLQKLRFGHSVGSSRFYRLHLRKQKKKEENLVVLVNCFPALLSFFFFFDNIREKDKIARKLRNLRKLIKCIRHNADIFDVIIYAKSEAGV